MWAFPRPITFEDNLYVHLRLSHLRASPGFMLGQPVSLAILELPLSRNLDLDHKLELHCSSLHHTKMQVRTTKSNSSFERKHTTSQIASGNIFFLGCTQCHAGLLPATPRSALLLNGTACPIRIHINLQVNFLICLILELIFNCTLQVPHCMLCNHQVNMSQCVHSKAYIWSCIH